MPKLTNYPMQRENKHVTLNQVIGFDSLKTTRQAAISQRAFEFRNGIFTLAFPLYCLFYGKQGRETFVSAGSSCQSVNLPFVSPFAFDSVKVELINQLEKAKTMSKPIPNCAQNPRKSSIHIPNPVSGFASWTAGTLPDINGILQQIPCSHIHAKRAIHTQFMADLTAFEQQTNANFALVLATIKAQIATDKHNGICPDAAALSAWRKVFAHDAAQVVSMFNHIDSQAEIVAALAIYRAIIRHTSHSKPRLKLAKKPHVMLPLSLQLIRRFPTLEKASVYLSHRVKSRHRERFAIQQTAPDSWAVCRVMKGGL